MIMLVSQLRLNNFGSVFIHFSNERCLIGDSFDKSWCLKDWPNTCCVFQLCSRLKKRPFLRVMTGLLICLYGIGCWTHKLDVAAHSRVGQELSRVRLFMFILFKTKMIHNATFHSQQAYYEISLIASIKYVI